MRFVWHSKSLSTKPKTIHRYRPVEWRVTHEERQNWHEYRVTKNNPRTTLEPINSIGNVLTAVVQAV